MPQSSVPMPANLDEPIISLMATNAKFAPLLAIYHADLGKNLPKVLEAQAAWDTATLQQLAHRLAGTGTSYGYPQLTTAARACEVSIRENAAETQIRQQLDTVIRIMRAALAGAKAQPVAPA